MSPLNYLLIFTSIFFLCVNNGNCVSNAEIDSLRYNYVSYFAEAFTTILKHHLGRYRPFSKQKGAPLIEIQHGKRSVDGIFHINF